MGPLPFNPITDVPVEWNSARLFREEDGRIAIEALEHAASVSYVDQQKLITARYMIWALKTPRRPSVWSHCFGCRIARDRRSLPG